MPWDTHRKPDEFADELRTFQRAMMARAKKLRRNAAHAHGGAPPVPAMLAARHRAADALEAAAKLLENRVFADFNQPT